MECIFDAQMVPLGSVEQSLLYLPEYITLDFRHPLTAFRSVKLLSERVATIERYLREVSNRDVLGRLSPKFKDLNQVSNDGARSRGLFIQSQI